MISVHEEMPSGGPINTVGKPPLNVLRMLIKNDLDYDWKLEKVERIGMNTALVIMTDGVSRMRRTIYLGPHDEMRLLLGAVGWYRANADDPSARSRLTSELFVTIGHPQSDPKRLLAELRERFEPFVSQVL